MAKQVVITMKDSTLIQQIVYTLVQAGFLILIRVGEEDATIVATEFTKIIPFEVVFANLVNQYSKLGVAVEKREVDLYPAVVPFDNSEVKRMIDALERAKEILDGSVPRCDNPVFH